jgi:hypothetical protein
MTLHDRCNEATSGTVTTRSTGGCYEVDDSERIKALYTMFR